MMWRGFKRNNCQPERSSKFGKKGPVTSPFLAGWWRFISKRVGWPPNETLVHTNRKSLFARRTDAVTRQISIGHTQTGPMRRMATCSLLMKWLDVKIPPLQRVLQLDLNPLVIQRWPADNEFSIENGRASPAISFSLLAWAMNYDGCVDKWERAKSHTPPIVFHS